MTKTKAANTHFNYSHERNSLKKRKCGVEIGLKMPYDFPQLLFQMHICLCTHFLPSMCSSKYALFCSVPILCRLSFLIRHGSRCSSWFTIAMLLLCLEIHFQTTIQYNVEVATNGPTYGWLLCCVGQDTGITKIRFNLFRRVHLKRHERLFINIVMKRSM